MNRIAQILIFLLFLISCNKDDINSCISENEIPKFISAVDISSYPEISDSNPEFFDFNNQALPALSEFKDE